MRDLASAPIMIFVFGPFEVAGGDFLVLEARGVYCGLVDEVFEVGAGHARSGGGRGWLHRRQR